MLKPSYSKQFEGDLKRMIKQGRKREKIKVIMRKLVNEDQLEPRHRNYKLVGKYKDKRECHVEPDWLLIYKTTSQEIVFERTGSHSDLFE